MKDIILVFDKFLNKIKLGPLNLQIDDFINLFIWYFLKVVMSHPATQKILTVLVPTRHTNFISNNFLCTLV